MRDDQVETRNPRLRKLLRVLVAGGVALAGVAGARADEKPAPSAESGAQQPAQGTEKKDQDQAKQKDKSRSDKKAKQDKKKKAEDAKADDGAGIKGW